MKEKIKILIKLLIKIFILGYVIMLLWNWIMPIYWHDAPTLTYWQALGTKMLIGCLYSEYRVVKIEKDI